MGREASGGGGSVGDGVHRIRFPLSLHCRVAGLWRCKGISISFSSEASQSSPAHAKHSASVFELATPAGREGAKKGLGY